MGPWVSFDLYYFDRGIKNIIEVISRIRILRFIAVFYCYNGTGGIKAGGNPG